ncbi:hypothetical protein [Hymenobacter lucidus]|uniref:Uncharacterized protein n=1 Tax=Hymenobacter lucidus TaxID=2880930 RepID=A0ABS8AST5_9BACT|nr:hypothetical protein [Hymenobacter lucidus]MCB2409268.1 hypothetical protein [Hymenobacter lucidus]
MRLNFTTARQLVAGMSLLAGLGLAGCADKSEEPAPAEAPCGTVAIVRLCPGNTLMCPTEHTTLELPDGTRLRPTGPLWETYEPGQVDGMAIKIGYTLGTPITSDGPGTSYATITCLDPAVWWCGTSDLMNRSALSPMRKLKSR